MLEVSAERPGRSDAARAVLAGARLRVGGRPRRV